jgi:hypothetical protein
MRYALLGLLFVLTGCQTLNATVDGAQHIVNETVQATGEGVAGVTTAVGKDVTGTITYVTDSAADGIRKATSAEK